MTYRRGQMEEEYDETFGVDREEAYIEDSAYDPIEAGDDAVETDDDADGPDSDDDLDEIDVPGDLVEELGDEREWEEGEDDL